MKTLGLMLLAGVCLFGQSKPVTAARVVRGSGVPSSSTCAALPDVGKVYIRYDAGAASSTFYVCANTASSTYAWELGGGGGGGTVCTVSGSQTVGYVLTATDTGTACDWEAVGAASVDANTLKNAWYLTDGGTANAVTGTTATTFPGAYATGQAVIFKANATNTTATTININSLGAKNLTKSGSTALAAGNKVSGTTYLAVYDGTQFQLVAFTAVAADIPACPTCVTSAASLTSNQLIIGAGSQAEAVLGSLGTTTTLLHGNAGGAPTFGAVALGADVLGQLPVANGGTALASGTSGGILCFTGSTNIASSGVLTANLPVIGGGAGVCPTAGSVTGTGTTFVTNTSPTLVTPNFTTSGTLSNNGIGAVSTDGWVLQNTTAATVGTTAQYSPRLHFIGSGWKTNSTAAAQQTEWIVENIPFSGAVSPENSLVFTPIRNGSSGSAIGFCQADGSASAANYLWLRGTAGRCDGGVGFAGINSTNSQDIQFTVNAGAQASVLNSVGFVLISGRVLSFASNSTLTAAGDAGVCRSATATVGINDGSATCATANYRDLIRRSDIAGGPAPGISGCSATINGGATRGWVTSGTSGTCTFTLTFATTAPTGWVCQAQDQTTPADIITQTAGTASTTTCTLSGTTVSGDVLPYTAGAF